MHKIDELFEEKDGTEEFQIKKYQCVEEILKIIGKIIILILLFGLLNKLGEFLAKDHFLLEGGFNSDILYSIFVLPLIYSLKDIKNCLDSCFVKAWKVNGCITVKKGWLNIQYDKLYLSEVNNIELERSFGGKIANYCTIHLYALGGILTIPYIKDSQENIRILRHLMLIAEKNNNLK